MTTDRDAFIAGIAADPDNDLRRLVFADWLEENGEPERAEFVRLQIEAERLTEAAELKPLNDRAKELFRTHGPAWLAPFLKALDPLQNPAEYIFKTDRLGNCFINGPPDVPVLPSYFRAAVVRRGFVWSLGIDLAALPAGGSVGAALVAEPVSRLAAFLSGNRQQWPRFSEPGLRHICELWVTELTAGGPPVACLAAFTDSHLPAVRTFGLVLSDGRVRPLPAPTVQLFANSPMAYRVTDLTLTLDDAGLRALCRSDRLRLDRLTVHGSITPAGVRLLNAAPFAPVLRSLTLSVRLTDEGAASLARATRFARLTELDLRGNELTAAGLRALAAARFVPQLEVLDLSANSIAPDDTTSGLRALADALNPDTLRRLRFSQSSCAEVPAYLTARFGDRVTVS
jgi:uncharacterized protein (TIGR02996 family)